MFLRPGLILVFCITADIGLHSVAVAQTSARTFSRFEFAIPGLDASESETDQRVLITAPAGKEGFVKVKDGHFFASDRRIKFWGMNVCFGSNFPEKEVADQLAPHLAKLGINAVRFHHMDNQQAPGGIWREVDEDGIRRFSDEMVDRLDYFLARLAEHGIYADLNLHVSRELTPEEGYPELRDVPWWAASNKWVMYYDPDVQSELKSYCRSLLLHKNPYRDQKRRVDDPAIALIEMMNENYFSVQGYSLYQKLPQRYQDSLIAAWNRWLAKKYKNTESMLQAWAKQQTPLGEVLIADASFEKNLGDWKVSKDQAEIKRTFNTEPPDEVKGRAIKLQPTRRHDQDHQCQLAQYNLSCKSGQPITLTYYVRSETPRKYHVELSSTEGGEWRDLGVYEHLDTSTQWQKVVRTVFPKETIERAVNVQFSFGDSTTAIEFAGITLQVGSDDVEVPSDQSIEKLNLLIPGPGSSVAAHQDMQQFMIDTEVAWVKEFKRFLREDLEVKVPIVASQVNYHAGSVNADENDFIDLHNYWHHPLFPSDSNWDAKQWTVGNEPMEADPVRSQWPANSLLMRTGWRYEGKPFTLSEWNYPEPSPFSAGCVPMAAVVASLQDWDGVFFFQYDTESKTKADWEKDHTTSFFSFNGQSVKLATFAVFANVFLRGDLKPLEDSIVAPVDQPLSGLLGLKHRLSVSTEKEKCSPKELLQTKIPEVKSDAAGVLESEDKTIVWNFDSKQQTGHVAINTPATRGVWGTLSDQSFETGKVRWDIKTIDPNYALMVATSMDAKPIESSNRILILAATSSENQSMGWNKDRNSVGDQWGQGPTKTVGVTATIKLPLSDDKPNVTVYSLDPTGQRVRKVPSQIDDGFIEFTIRPNFKTLWYEVVR
jgi:hypothetical protein